MKLYSASLMNFNNEKFGIMMRVFGISNCDKCREAKKWLAKKEIDFEFIDFRKQALTAEDIKRWIKNVGEEKLMNKRGTTWRDLPDELKQNFENGHSVYELTPNDHHDHMVDVDTNEVIEFVDEEIEARQHAIAAERGYEIIDHSLVLYVREKR